MLYLFYMDLEADSCPLKKITGKQTVKLQQKRSNSYGYTLIQKDSKIMNECINDYQIQFRKNMKRDLEEIIKPALQNPVEHKMTAHDWKKHDASHICDICVRLLQEYYDNETQKFNGAAHNGCVEEAKPAAQKD
ncbi:unnamed protein product [Rhizophagus irregularis]|nr:unnamed protein product [Rhizophagus irregularis]